MSNNAHAILLILTMTAGTMATRFLPFLLLGDKRQTPPFIAYLGKVLPYAIMGMLVVYCLKGVSLTEISSVLPAVLGVGIVLFLPAALWVKITVAYAVSEVIFLFSGTSFAPMISAIVLPVLLSTAVSAAAAA